MWALSLPDIEGDPAFHAQISRSIASSGIIQQHSLLFFSNPGELFPIMYPQFFHLVGAILYLYIGETAFTMMPLFFGVLLSLVSFLLIRRCFKSKTIALFGAGMVATNWQFIQYSTRYYMEIGVTLFVLSSLYFIVSYVDEHNFKYGLMSAQFTGLAICTKQQAFFMLPIFIGGAFAEEIFNNNNLKRFVVLMLIVMVCAGGLLAELFSTTGSLFYSGKLPTIIEKFEGSIAGIAGIHRINEDPKWMEYNISKRQNETNQWRNAKQILDFLNPFRILTAGSLEPASLGLWLVLLMIGLLYIIHRIIFYRDICLSYMLAYFIVFIVVFYILARPRYLLPLCIAPAFIISSVLSSVKHHFRYMTIVIMVTAATIGTSFINVHALESLRADIGYAGYRVDNRVAQMKEVHAWLKKDNVYKETIITPVVYTTSYYTESPCAWMNPLGSSEIFETFMAGDTARALEVFARYNARYICIYKERLRQYDGWVGVIPPEGLFPLLGRQDGFKKVYENDAAIVYKIEY